MAKGGRELMAAHVGFGADYRNPIVSAFALTP